MRLIRFPGGQNCPHKTGRRRDGAMTWKKKLMALLLAAVSILGVACGDGAEDSDVDNTLQISRSL